jgi:hypothetical protein
MALKNYKGDYEEEGEVDREVELINALSELKREERKKSHLRKI